MTDEQDQARRRGYGNIYTPHAGSMIIQVQREGGLANRTLILSTRAVRWLRLLTSRPGKIFLFALAASWVFFAVQAFRVPLLTREVGELERNAQRLDTLQVTLLELQARYAQVQRMLGATGVNVPPLPGVDSTAPTVPSRWPLEGGYISRATTAATEFAGSHGGVDIAVPVGTEVRAAGAGSVVEVGTSDDYGLFVRIAHAEGYETLYAHTSRVLVAKGARVAAGQVVALSGNTGRSTAPHLHFEVRHDGESVDPLQLLKKEQD